MQLYKNGEWGMKKFLSIMLVLCMALSLTGCKSAEVKAVEAAIDEIGDVSYNSGEIIEEARDLYDDLSEKDKEKVGNLETLEEAEEAYEKAKDDLMEDVMAQVDSFNENMDVMNMAGIKENIAAIRELFDSMEPDVKGEILQATSQGEETLLSLCDKMESLLPDLCVPNTDLARPEFVVTVDLVGAWIVDDRTDFDYYNVWCTDEYDVYTAFEEYCAYLASYVTVNQEADGSVSFTDDLGQTCYVRTATKGVLQVLVPKN